MEAAVLYANRMSGVSRKPNLSIAVFGGFSAVKLFWQGLGVGHWLEERPIIESELRCYSLYSCENALGNALPRLSRFYASEPLPSCCLWIRGVRQPYGPDFTPPGYLLFLAAQLGLPVIVLHFSTPGAPVPDDEEIALREYMNNQGLSGDEVPILQCPSFEESPQKVKGALWGLGPFLDEAVPMPSGRQSTTLQSSRIEAAIFGKTYLLPENNPEIRHEQGVTLELTRAASVVYASAQLRFFPTRERVTPQQYSMAVLSFPSVTSQTRGAPFSIYDSAQLSSRQLLGTGVFLRAASHNAY